MDRIHVWGVERIIELQRLPIFFEHPYSFLWILATKLGDPATIFTLHAPLLFVFLNESATFVQFFLSSCISEFLNGVFKWALMADRPYWWIHTSGHGNGSELSQMKQFEPTCETGPGSPSGHCMITAAAWIILIYSRRSKMGKILSVLAYVISLIILALSRLYIGTHFPHQVVLGAVIGAIVGTICYGVQSTSVKLVFCLKLIAGLLVTAVATYQSLLFMGYDPDWSISLAQRYCQDPRWIHLSNTPFASLYRDTGSLIGLGVVAKWFGADLWMKYEGASFGTKALGFGLSSGLAWVITSLPVMRISRSLIWFYSCIFVEHAVLFLVYAVVIPKLLGVGLAKKEKAG